MAEPGPVAAGSSGVEEPKSVNENQDSQNGTTGSAPKDTNPKQGAKPPTVPRAKRPNYAKIHAQPLPIVVYPLPAFVPHNPLSLLRIAWIIVSQYFSPPPSHPPSRHIGYWSAETRSVHVTDPASVRALWEQGFFGKGNLSRSEPTWLDREQQRRGVLSGRIMAEDFTQLRRNERKEFKNERARKEREAIEEQLRKEGKLVEKVLGETVADAVPISQTPGGIEAPAVNAAQDNNLVLDGQVDGSLPEAQTNEVEQAENSNADILPSETVEDEPIENQEHLQLSLEEAFFLVYGLGVLDVVDPQTNKPIDPMSFFQLSRSYSYFPPCEISSLRPDDSFLLKYVVYHHFRSRGWVARDGVKFSVDFMLYNRGPVFSHAEFAVQIIPSYSDPYWSDKERKDQNPWWWLHCVNRVQAQVLKTMVLVYVEVPPPLENEEEVKDIGAFLKRYKVREFVLKRWVANRMRA